MYNKHLTEYKMVQNDKCNSHQNKNTSIVEICALHLVAGEARSFTKLNAHHQVQAKVVMVTPAVMHHQTLCSHSWQGETKSVCSSPGVSKQVRSLRSCTSTMRREAGPRGR